MKKKILIILVVIVSYYSLPAQNNWEWITFCPTGNKLSTAVTVGNSVIFWGDMKTILRTNDAGNSFIYANSYEEIKYDVSFEGGYQKVAFSDSLNGFLLDGSGYTTTNSGRSWIPNENVKGDVGLFINKSIGIILKRLTFMKTYDGGKNWNSFPSPDLKYMYLPQRIFALDENKMWIVTAYHEYAETSILYSTNGGHFWKKIVIPGLKSDNKARLSYHDIKFEKNGTGIAVGEINYIFENRTSSVILKSTDYGVTWEWKEYDNVKLTNIISFGSGNWLLYGNDKNNSVLQFVSNDSGSSWGPTYNLFSYDIPSAFGSSAYLSKSNVVIVATSNGFYKSRNNGKSYAKISNGLDIGITDIKFDSKGSKEEQTAIAYSDRLDYLLSSSGGRQWERKTFPDFIGYGNKDIEIVNKTISVKTWDQNVFISNDNGETWRALFFLEGKSVLNFSLYDDKNFAVIGYLNGLPKLFLSTNGGNAWSVIPIDNRVGLQSLKHVNEDFIIGIGEFYESGAKSGILFMSYDNGNLWRIAESHYIFNEVSFVNQKTGYILNNTDLMRTTNSGDSWEFVYQSHLPDKINSAAFIDSSKILLQIYSDNIYMPKKKYFVSSTDKGNHWSEANLKLPLRGNLRKICVNTYGDIFVLGENGELLINKSYYNLRIDNEPNNETAINSGYSLLKQNYPNPFNPSTTIEYIIPNVETHHGASPTHVTLKIYDILGREIAALVNEQQLPGTYKVDFNVETRYGEPLSSGIYFYRLQVNSLTNPEESYVQTKKMLFLK